MNSDDLDPRVLIRLLGPSEVVVAGRVVPVGSLEQRAVQAVLALQHQAAPAASTIQRLIFRLGARWPLLRANWQKAMAELETGRAGEALARLEPHVVSNRLRERGWGLLMVAPYRLGRQAAALRAYQRAILREETEREPSSQLAETERRILRHDPCLGAPRRPLPGCAAIGPWSSCCPASGNGNVTDGPNSSETFKQRGLQFEQGNTRGSR